jgi:hypothetical protein
VTSQRKAPTSKLGPNFTSAKSEFLLLILINPGQQT